MGIYNGLVVARNRFENAFAQEGDARRRHQGPQQRDDGRAESRRQPQRPRGHQAA
jgi:hypothetical protein